MHGLIDADVHPSIIDKVVQVVPVDDLLWDDFDGKSHELWSIHLRAHIEVGYVHGEVFCAGCGQD